MPAAIGKQAVLPFTLTWNYKVGGELSSPHQVFIENDVTTHKLLPKPGSALDMRDKAEASMLIGLTFVPQK